MQNKVDLKSRNTKVIFTLETPKECSHGCHLTLTGSLTCDKHSLLPVQISFAGLFVRRQGQEEVGVVKLKREAAVPGPGATAEALLTQDVPAFLVLVPRVCPFVVCSNRTQ